MPEAPPLIAVRAPRLSIEPGLVQQRLLLGDEPLAVGLMKKGAKKMALVADVAGAPVALWDGAAASAAFARQEGPGIWCAMAGGPLLRVETAASGGPTVVERLATGAPAAIGHVGNTLWGLWPGGPGKVPEVAPLDPEPGARQPGPEPGPAGRISALAGTGAGALAALEADARGGFRVHVLEPDGWRVMTEAGAARYGFNAAVVAAVPWGAGLAVASGMDLTARARVPGLAHRGEILRLAPDGDFDILAGELRVSPWGLKVPLAGARTEAVRERGGFTHLSAAGPNLIAAMETESGHALVFRFSAEGEAQTLGQVAEPIEDLAVGPDGTVFALLGSPAEP